jgi:hypothetical protein
MPRRRGGRPMTRCERAPAWGLDVVTSTLGGLVKREVKAARGAGEGVGVTRGRGAGVAGGVGVGVGATCGAGATRGTDWGTGATRGMAIVSEVPVTEEG